MYFITKPYLDSRETCSDDVLLPVTDQFLSFLSTTCVALTLRFQGRKISIVCIYYLFGSDHFCISNWSSVVRQVFKQWPYGSVLPITVIMQV